MGKLSKSEQEVINAIKGIGNLPTEKRGGIRYYKRHNKAIELLKAKGFIYLDSDYLLKLCVNAGK
jgi:hypothetical protein